MKNSSSNKSRKGVETMTMRLSQLRTYLTADDAHQIISFLDDLRETLWSTYGAQINDQKQQENQYEADQNDQQRSLALHKDIEF